MTSPDGINWSEPQALAKIVNGHYQISWLWKNKIGTAFNYHPEKGLNWRTNLYYMETTNFGQTWTNAHGENINFPLTAVSNNALVRDYKSEGLLIYTVDINYDADGNPREPSESRLYFCNKTGEQVFRLPYNMTKVSEPPTLLSTGGYRQL